MGGPNICFKCQRACGGCSWSADFEPVPGWTAEPALLNGGIETYHITACPLFLPDKPRAAMSKRELTAMEVY